MVEIHPVHANNQNIKKVVCYTLKQKMHITQEKKAQNLLQFTVEQELYLYNRMSQIIIY